MKMTQEDIFATFRPKGITRGGELYVSPSLGIQMADVAAENGLAVVGVDAAVLQERATIPQPDLTADFSALPRRSWVAYVEGCHRECQAFLRTLPDRSDLFVSLVLVAGWEK